MKQSHYYRYLMLMVFVVNGACSQLVAQSTISPEVQNTIRQYAGKDAKPVVPVAMLNAKEPLGDEAARWLSAQRQQKLITYSLNPNGSNYFGLVADSVASKFRAATEAGSVLYFDEADFLYGKAGLNEAQQKMAAALAAASKKFPNGVLMKCASEECWFALAKMGFGIVKLDY